MRLKPRYISPSDTLWATLQLIGTIADLLPEVQLDHWESTRTGVLTFVKFLEGSLFLLQDVKKPFIVLETLVLVYRQEKLPMKGLRHYQLLSPTEELVNRCRSLVATT